MRKTRNRGGLGPELAVFVLDSAPAYPVEAGLESWRRTLIPERGQRVVVEDRYALKAPLPVEWSFMSWRRPEAEGAGRIRLIHPGDGNEARPLHMIYNKQVLEDETIELKDARLRGSWGDRICRILLATRSPARAGRIKVRIEGGQMSTSHHRSYFRALAVAALVMAVGACGGNPMSVEIQRKTCQATDAVTIVYSVAGTGEPAIVFIHGGLANRGFWDGQLRALGGHHRTIALDLPGHGESGANRKRWGLPEFGADVKAVVEAEKAKKVILFGNSLGGPVAIEAALLLPGRVLGVVGVDTFQQIDYVITEEEVGERARLFENDYAGSLKQMVGMLFHKDADPALIADAEKRMTGTPPAAAGAMFRGMAGYDGGAAVRRLAAPLRAINGDLYPTDVEGNRKVKTDFDVVIMTHMGHYPMLERPEEFNRRVAEMISGLTK